MKKISAIKFMSFEDLGYFESHLKAENYHIQYYQAGVDDLSDVFESTTLLFILGGPIGVYETQDYPFLQNIVAQLKRRLDRKLPTVGICLGAQLIATALGGKVYSGNFKEIGWGTLQLTENACLNSLKDIPVLHWHGDTFELPQQAECLASTVYYTNQAFKIDKHILALQFHPEVDYEKIEIWLIGHTTELRQANIDIQQLRLDSQKYGPLLKKNGYQFLKNWIKNLEIE